MITLEKLLNELSPASLNEIVAGKYCGKKKKSHKSSSSKSKSSSSKSKSKSTKKYKCGCRPCGPCI